MIKFFRKIRRQLLTENKISKYLIYAIGEIALVVIGILIALLLNTNNTDRVNRNKEITLLSEMSQNLKLDLADIEWNIMDNNKKMYSNQMVLNHLEGKSVNSDSINYFYNNLKGGTVLIKNTSAFDNLNSIGFDLISNDSLRQLITRLYSEKYNYLDHLEVEYEQAFQMNHIYYQVNSKILNAESEKYAEPLDYISLQKDNLFKETLRQNIGGKEWIIAYQKEIKSLITELMQLIEKEITKG